jgi:[ribosomal protein S5]-alanine N-acetyltransferase
MIKEMNLKFNETIFNKFPVLETERLVFRQFHKKDGAQLFKIRSNPQVMEFMDAIILKSEDGAKVLLKSFHREFRDKKGVTWAITDKQTNQLIGSFGFWRITKPHNRAEIGYSLLPEYWGKGLMAETFKTLIEFGFNQMQVHSIEANVNPQNQKSIQLLERVGFKKEAHFRENFFYKDKYLDSAIYCLVETDERNY